MNMRPEPKLLVQPAQHVFEVNEDTKKASQILTLTNPDPQYLFYYKIRTTGRARYVVKPNSGMVAPSSTLAIELVFTLPLGEDLSKPIFDKFVVYFKSGTKFMTDRKRIEDYLTENMATCDKFQVNAVARLAQSSSGFKTSLNLVNSVRQVNYTGAEASSPRFPLGKAESLKDSDKTNSELGRSNNVSGISKEERVNKMMESMKAKISESLLSNSRPMVQTLPLRVGRPAVVAEPVTGKSPVLKSSLFEAQFSNDVLFEKTNKMLTPDESELPNQVVKDPAAFISFQKINDDKEHAKPRQEAESGVYQQWHLILALILGTIIGAYLNGAK